MIEGIVRQTSEVMFKIDSARFKCDNCKNIITVMQNDEQFKRPNQCSCGTKSQLKLLDKQRVNSLQLILEENNKNLKEISVILKDDIIIEPNKILGKRIKIEGPLKDTNKIEADNIKLEEPSEDIVISKEDKKRILELASDPDLYKIIEKTISPAIYGFEKIKEAGILQLFGGDKKSNIHILLIGNLGTAKTELIKIFATILPNNIYIKCNRQLKENLTAEIIKKNNGIFIKGGPISLARRGICYVDNLEKIHKVPKREIEYTIDDQRVNIDHKNGSIPVDTNTSLFVIADREEYDYTNSKVLSEEFVDKFDIIFDTNDKLSKYNDEKVSSKILDTEKRTDDFKIVDTQLLKKYIIHARTIKPKLTPDAEKALTSFWFALRRKGAIKGSSKQFGIIAPRQFKSLIKLADAYARIRLSNETCFEDVMSAINFYQRSSQYREIESIFYTFNNIQNITTVLS